MSRLPQCPHEAHVLAHFLDADASIHDASVASHLEQCSSCARAVEESRRIDALLAAQTQTEISDEKASDLLAFLRGVESEPVECEPVALTPAREEHSGAWRAVAWLGLAAASVLAFVWWPSSGHGSGHGVGDGRIGDNASHSVAERRVGRNGAGKSEPAKSPRASVGYRLPRDARFTMLTRKGSPGRKLTNEDLLAAFGGHWVSGLDRSRLLREAETLLRGHGYDTPRGSILRLDALRQAVRSSAAAAVGPRRLSAQDRLIVAATEWLLGELRSGRAERSELELLADGVSRSRGYLRRQLVDLVRRDRESVAAAPLTLRAAVGDMRANRLIARRSYSEVQRAALAILQTGDAQAVDCLLDLYLEVASRSSALGEVSRVWFDALERPQRQTLARSLADRARASPQRLHKDLCERLLARLGLATSKS